MLLASTGTFQDLTQRRAQEALLEVTDRRKAEAYGADHKVTIGNTPDCDAPNRGYKMKVEHRSRACDLEYIGSIQPNRATDGNDWRPPKPKSIIGYRPRVIVADHQTKTLFGLVTVITGGSRGLGKGIAEEFATNGGMLYLTGRSTMDATTDQLLAGSVDETANMTARTGGHGIAVHCDHADDVQNRAVVKMLAENHGKVDVLVNNAFFLSKPDMLFFGAPVWKQPVRFVNEQFAVGGRNHAVLTVMMLPLLRRGKGLVCNISSWGSQTNIGSFPIHYYTNKAAFDQMVSALNHHLRKSRIYVFTIWPGAVKNERTMLSAKRTGQHCSDMESSRFTGKAIHLLSNCRADLLDKMSKRRTFFAADLVCMSLENDTDGYKLEPNLHTFQTVGTAPEGASKGMPPVHF